MKLFIALLAFLSASVVSAKNEKWNIFTAMKAENAKEIVSLVASGQNLNIKDDDGATPLYLAILAKQPLMVKYFLDHGANPNIPHAATGEFPAHKAAELGQIESLRYLFHAGADVNARTEARHTPLFYAGNVATLEELINAGADVTARDASGRNPLFFIADETAQEAIKPLIKAGARVNTQDIDGNTPLHTAIMRGKPNLVKALLDHDADLNIFNKAQKTPYMYGKESDFDSDILNAEIIKLVDKHLLAYLARPPILKKKPYSTRSLAKKRR
jgi:ankyrin repeat protein